MVQVKYNKILINNKWVDSVSGKKFATINPSTEEKITDVSEGDKADIEKAVAAANDAFKYGSEWRSMDPAKRGKILFKLASLLSRDRQYLAELESLDNGKPLNEAFGDIDSSIAMIEYYGGWADKVNGKTIPSLDDQLTYTKIEPVGVCGQIIPWNFPILMFVFKVAPATASGCTVIIKPAEQTPLTALYLGQLCVEAGFPPGVVNVVPGFGPTAGAALVDHPKVDKIAFTGSTEVGKLIQSNAAKTLKRVSLELGGKSPLVVTENFDLAKAALIANLGCFFNMGQCCCAATRTYVHESVYEAFIEEAAKIAKSKVVGSPFDEATSQGPQIDGEQTSKIIDLIESGKKQGARLVTGGSRVNKKGYFIEPTVFADVDDNMRIAREEIFGPVQQIFKYKNLDEAIKRCNDTNYGLAAGILTNDINQALSFANQIRAGSVWVNNYFAISERTPFGGFKESGIGRECGEDGLHEYCEIKTISIKLA